MSENFGVWSIDIELFECIKKLLPPGKTILEFGSGFSTLKLSEFYNVISIEENKNYIGKYKSTYIYAPIKKIKPQKHFQEFDKWYDADVIQRGLQGKSYDLMLIDGPMGANTVRPGIYKYRNLFNWDIPVIFDDSNNHFLWRLIVVLCRNHLKRHSALTLNMDKRKCFTVLHPDKEKLKTLL